MEHGDRRRNKAGGRQPKNDLTSFRISLNYWIKKAGKSRLEVARMCEGDPRVAAMFIQ